MSEELRSKSGFNKHALTHKAIDEIDGTNVIIAADGGVIHLDSSIQANFIVQDLDPANPGNILYLE